MSVSRSSPTVVPQRTESPSSVSRAEMWPKLVLMVLPVRISSPVQRISMIIRVCPQLYDVDLAQPAMTRTGLPASQASITSTMPG